MLLAARGYVSYGLIWKLIFPFILVAIGIKVVWSGVFGEPVKEKIKSVEPNDLDSIAAVFSEEYRIVEKSFKGAVVDAVFGSVKLDLREAKISKEASLKVSAIFGGVDIIVPKNVTLKVKSTKIFGGVEQQYRDSDSKDKNGEKIIYIEATSIFGGIKIK